MAMNKFNCEAFNLQHITNLKEVEQFAIYLAKDLGMYMRADDHFEDYYDLDTDEPSFSKDELESANRLMVECFDISKKMI